MRGPILHRCERDHSSSVARAIEHLFVGGWPEGPVGLKKGAMAPVGPLYFVARHANAWIMPFYILTMSFVTFVDWTVLGTGLDGDGAISYQTSDS